MASYKNMGTVETAAFDSATLSGGNNDYVAARLARFANDSATSSANAFLVSELEKRDPLIRKPLTTYTWSQNIPVRSGGGMVQFISNLSGNYGSAGSEDGSEVVANGAVVSPTIQGNILKDIYKTHIFEQTMSINEYDMERQAITGRSLDSFLSDGVRLNYEKHMDKNVFIGIAALNQTGLLNNPDVYSTTVGENAAGTSTLWKDKNADEILYDVNNGINYTWAEAGNDMSAIPNHILLPFEQYNYLLSTKVSDIGQISIMEFLKANNIVKNFGQELVFGVSLWGKGAGTGGTDRMAIYRHEEKFMAVEELKPLSRRNTIYLPQESAYVSKFYANVSEVELFYKQSISYWDGI
jgi:hypothetical protein